MKRATLILAVAILALGALAHADIAYMSGGGGIYSWNTSGSAAFVLSGSPGGLDSLIFDTHGNIVFSQISSGTIGVYNPTTHATHSLICCGSGVADMALDPSGNSVLVSNAFSTTIWRVDLTTGALLNNFNVGARPDGLAYDDSGDLFAVLGENRVSEINPTTGAIMKTIFAPSGCGTADALTFNSTTSKLYMSCDSAGGFATFDTGLTSATYTALSFSPDGIASNGDNLYFVQRGGGGIQYNLTTNTITASSVGIGGDDIAPLSGLGSSTVPEPGSLMLLGTGLVGLAGTIRRRLQR